MKKSIVNKEIEQEILKEAAFFEPVSTKQVIRAITEYEDYLDFDVDDNLIKDSVKNLVKVLVKKEPNLFKKSMSVYVKGKKSEALELMGIKKKQ